MRWRILLVSFAASLLTACSTARPDSPQRFEFTQPQMGVPFRIVLYAASDAAATNAALAAFQRIKELNDILSDYDEDSELSRLSRTSGQKKRVKVSDDLWTVLQRAQQIAQQSEGAFDITVGPCVTLWRKARREKRFPDAAKLQAARTATGWQNLRLNEKDRTAELLVPNMRLDLGGIAKGYAVDEAQKVLQKKGIGSALVSGGGDMFVTDPPPGKDGWKIELSSLDANAPKQFVSLSHLALATSGDTFQFVEFEGKRYSHIVDPRTGIGLTDHSLVNIIARDCTTADAFATAVSVLGPEKGLQLVEKTKGVAARIQRRPVDKVETYETKRFERFYTSTR